jgi:diguanylate cyclase (GGDEF)-like protein
MVGQRRPAARAAAHFGIADSVDRGHERDRPLLRTPVFRWSANDLQTLEMPLAARAALLDSGFRSVVALPLLVDRTPVGALMLTSYDVGAVADESCACCASWWPIFPLACSTCTRKTRSASCRTSIRLTGLAKRGLFCERVVRALEPRIGRRGTPAVAVLDIEHLSTINDSFGRHAGDLLLQQVADRMKQHFDSTELLAHFGAGTFGVIMEAAGDEDEAVHWMQAQIMDVFRVPFAVDARGIPVDVKCGFARYPGQWHDANALVQNAEAAVAQRQEHRREVPAPSPRLSAAVVSRMTMEHRLRAAIERQDFCAALPAQVRRAHREIRGLEALLRWRDPEAGLVMPGRFLSLMESSGLIVPLGRLDPAPGGGGSAALDGAGTGLGPSGREHFTCTTPAGAPFADHLLDLVGEWRRSRPASTSRSPRAC